MSELLVPLSEFTVEEAYRQIRGRVAISKEVLRRRYSPGTLRRYGSTTLDGIREGKQAAERAIRADDAARKGRGNVWHFAISAGLMTNDDPLIAGLASVTKGQELGAVRFGLPLAIARRLPFAVKQYPNTQDAANVTGWTIPLYDELLPAVYQKLVAFSNEQGIDHTWTIEPVAVPERIHHAIASAGMTPVGTPKYFDVGESADVPVPWSFLYSRELARSE